MSRILERTCQLLRETGFSGDVRKAGGVDLPLIQKFVNFWFSQSLDLHGSEVSSNAAAYFSNGLKGRAEEDKFDDDHVLAGNMYVLDMMDDSGLIIREEVPMRNALNEVLRDWYVGDCQAGVDRWNKRVLEAHGMSDRIVLPSRRFNRKVGVYAGKHFDPFGQSLTAEEWERRKLEWLPVARGQGLPAQHPGGSGLQAGPVRQLHRPAAAGDQPAADRLRIRPDRGLTRESGRRHRGRKPCLVAVRRRLAIPIRSRSDANLLRLRWGRGARAERSAGQHLLVRDDARAGRGDPGRPHGPVGARDAAHRRGRAVLLRRRQHRHAEGRRSGVQVLLLPARQRDAEPARADAEAGDRGAERPLRRRRARSGDGRRLARGARRAPARSACRKWRSASCPAPAARSGWRGWSARPRRWS